MKYRMRMYDCDVNSVAEALTIVFENRRLSWDASPSEAQVLAVARSNVQPRYGRTPLDAIGLIVRAVYEDNQQQYDIVLNPI